MNNLADVVLEYYWFLNFCSDDELDPDTAVKHLENLADVIANEFTPQEQSALRESADRWLASWLREPDEHGYTPRKLLTPDKRAFLEQISKGQFAGPPIVEGEV
jgi:hypothetical protein